MSGEMALKNRSAPAVERGVKILIIDDAAFQRAQLSRLLREAGHEVIEAANGQEGFERLTETPEVIVCDLLMPGIDGFGFLEGLRLRRSSVPVVIASANIQRTARIRCTELGARRFVPKPYGADRILRAIAEAVAAESPS
jgi:CheY-like chemotaxis protein